MTATKLNVAALVEQMPHADSPGKTSKFTGPTRYEAERVVTQILDGGREALLELVRMIRDANGAGERNYKPGYVLHCVALHVGRPGYQGQRRMFAETLASKLGGDEPSKDIQGFLIRELQVAGSERVAAGLGKLLDDDELCEYAAQALIAIGEGAAARFREALPGAKGKNRITIVQALGVVRDPESVTALGGAAREKDQDVRLAAAWALANIGDHRGADAVIRAVTNAGGWERIQMIKACLLLAENLLADGSKAAAVRIYETLRDTCQDPADRYVREAAERALAAVS